MHRASVPINYFYVIVNSTSLFPIAVRLSQTMKSAPSEYFHKAYNLPVLVRPCDLRFLSHYY